MLDLYCFQGVVQGWQWEKTTLSADGFLRIQGLWLNYKKLWLLKVIGTTSEQTSLRLRLTGFCKCDDCPTVDDLFLLNNCPWWSTLQLTNRWPGASWRDIHKDILRFAFFLLRQVILHGFLLDISWGRGNKNNNGLKSLENLRGHMCLLYFV